MEPVIHQNMDYFVAKMREQGGNDGMGIVEWTNWLAMDLSADLCMNEKMSQMKESKLFTVQLPLP